MIAMSGTLMCGLGTSALGGLTTFSYVKIVAEQRAGYSLDFT